MTAATARVSCEMPDRAGEFQIERSGVGGPAVAKARNSQAELVAPPSIRASCYTAPAMRHRFYVVQANLLYAY